MDRWIIVFENAQGIEEKVHQMIGKMGGQLAPMYEMTLEKPRVEKVQDIKFFDWRLCEGAQFLVVVLNSRGNRNILTKKYEFVK